MFNILKAIIGALLGGFFGKYRGGIFHNRDEVVARIKPRWLSRTVYFLVQGDTINSVAFGLFCAFYLEHDYAPWALFLWQTAVMWRFAAPGWGDYIGAAKGTQATDLSEVFYIDRIIEPLRDRPRLWGVAGLSIRCGEWGAMIGAPFLNPFPMLAGLLAGPIVYLLSKILPHESRFVWPIFEIVLGMLLWGSLFLQ